MKEEKEAAKEAFDGTALAQLLLRPGRRQAGAVLLTFGVPRDDRCGVQSAMDPGDKLEAPIASIQADHARANGVETQRPLEQRASKRGIMEVGRGEQKEDGQTRAATEQGMHAIAA